MLNKRQKNFTFLLISFYAFLWHFVLSVAPLYHDFTEPYYISRHFCPVAPGSQLYMVLVGTDLCMCSSSLSEILFFFFLALQWHVS